VVDNDTDNDGVCNANEVVGCQTVGACNYNPAATDAGSCIIATGCDTCAAGAVVDGDTDNDGVCDVNEIVGCQTPGACNYNAAATDAGTCIIATGCDTCAAGALVDGDTDNDGVCNANEIVGCQTAGACNYNAAATDPATCVFATGCDTCSGGAVVDGDTDNDGVCNVNEIVGCQTAGACNYNAAATDAATCYFATGCDYCQGGAVVDGDTDNDGVCNANEVVGCQTVGATNYNPLATDPGPCPGCTLPNADNYNAFDDLNNGTCVLGGCMYEAAMNYDENATYDDESCLFNYPGCTNAAAPNYNPLAVVDDGSCLISGCMDPEGLNYNPLATFSGGCDYPDSCPGDINGDGNITVEDLLNLFQVYGTSCPD
jgi:hypothetical protein